jgi:hypothetical protein
MTEYKCGNCREILILSPKARFCPECGSSSLNLVIRELKEPSQKETIGVYSPPPTQSELYPLPTIGAEDSELKQEEDQPRRPRRR